jgi:RNA polymerase sigma-70 factor (ECF subfamily)
VEFIFAAIYNAPVAGVSKATSAARQALAHEAMIHLDHLYRFASHLTKDHEQAQDLVQETFARAIAAHEQFIPGTNLKAWLARILYNFFVDHYQKNKRWAPLENPNDEGNDQWNRVAVENPGPESQLLGKELGTQISDGLAALPEEFRTPLLLVDMSDFSYEEAAAIMSCPIGTIRSRLSRGRKLMQQQLAAYVRGDQRK